MIGFSTTICPEFWDREYTQKYAHLWRTGTPDTAEENAICENGIGMFALCAEKEGCFKYWFAGLYQGGEVPEDWADGYENVVVCCTIENQRNADKKLPIFSALPIRHKCITAQPLLERVELEPYLDGVELVVAGGESDRDARQLDYA